MNAVAASADPGRLLADLIAGKYPDARGRFGPFGGRYVPETLIPALERLDARRARASCTAQDFQRRARGASCKSWVGRPTALTFAAAALGALGRARSGSSARTWRTPARTRSTTRIGQALLAQAPGREAHRRRDRRRPARRRQRRRLRAPGPAVHGVHGRGRHGAPGAERRPHAPARRDGRAGDQRRSHAARGDRRGAARLGGRSRPTPTTCSARRSGRIRIRTWCASCRPSSAARRARRCWRATGRAAGCAHRLRRRRLELHRHLPCLRRRTRRSRSSASRRAAAARGLGENAATLAYGTSRRAARHATRCCCRTRTARSRRRTRCPPASTTRASAPSTRCSQRSAACATTTASDEEALAARARLLSECEGILPALESAHALAGAQRWARRTPGAAHPDRALRARRQGHADAAADAAGRSRPP